MKKVYSSIILFFVFFTTYAQRQGIILGTIKDKNTQELIIGATIKVENSAVGAVSDDEGKFRIEIPTGSYNVIVSFAGYKTLTKYNLVVTSGNAQIINFELENEDNIETVEVTDKTSKSASAATLETPLSIQRLTTEEIKSNPGGNFDISRVIQALPGVGGTAGSVGGFRNDIIIRGGAPNENVYYLDGIEVPVINHFATQGAAGGPTGILNVSFIEDVTLSSSAFHSRFDNALSSVLEFKQREGNRERFSGNARLSGTELATTFEGPISKKTTFLASARRSYLQFLFKALDLPIRPNYWDFQYKISSKLNEKTTLTAIGIGAIDEFTFGVPRESDANKEYILRSNPSINQWNYTVGFSLKRLIDNGFLNIALSRNMFDNRLDRFEDAQFGDESRRTLRVRSQEIENKLRIDVNKKMGDWKWSYGGVAQYVKYNTNFFNRFRKEIRDENNNIVQPQIDIRANSAIDFARFGFFGQATRSIGKWGLSGGIRSDMNSFTDTGLQFYRTLSPRISASYQINDKWFASGSVGRYFKMPIYTVLGFRDENNNLVNRNMPYVANNHYTAGIEFLPKSSLRFTLEGFYKTYENYPVSLREGVSLANQGGNFSAIGNEPVSPTGKGRTYGMEFLAQQKLVKNLFFTASYTLFWSEFTDLNNNYIVSAWDTRHLFSAILGKKFKKGWEIGLKYRFQGGAPFTPFDLEASQRNYLSIGEGLLDLNRYNTQRLGAFQSFDFRLDKKINFNKWTLDLYLDVVNAFLLPSPAFPQYTFERTLDNTGFATTDGQPIRSDGSNAKPLILDNNDPSVLPTIGFIIEF
ncbi:TonB-dependent receptor [bacterium 336/3]|nr:TonB-dependent receptor [bacterium 336/3]